MPGIREMVPAVGVRRWARYCAPLRNSSSSRASGPSTVGSTFPAFLVTHHYSLSPVPVHDCGEVPLPEGCCREHPKTDGGWSSCRVIVPKGLRHERQDADRHRRGSRPDHRRSDRGILRGCRESAVGPGPQDGGRHAAVLQLHAAGPHQPDHRHRADDADPRSGHRLPGDARRPFLAADLDGQHQDHPDSGCVHGQGGV